MGFWSSLGHGLEVVGKGIGDVYGGLCDFASTREGEMLIQQTGILTTMTTLAPALLLLIQETPELALPGVVAGVKGGAIDLDNYDLDGESKQLI